LEIRVLQPPLLLLARRLTVPVYLLMDVLLTLPTLLQVATGKLHTTILPEPLPALVQANVCATMFVGVMAQRLVGRLEPSVLIAV